MRKKVFGRKLSRSRKSRIALERSLLRALIDNGQVKTTLAKAKFVTSSIEKLVSLGKKGTLSSERQILAVLGNDRKALKKFFENILPSLKERKSGFTRIVKFPKRLGDMADLAILSFVDEIIVPVKKEEEKKEKGKGSKESGKKETKKAKKQVKKAKVVKKETKSKSKAKK